VSAASIREYWGAISDRCWAVASCLERGASSEGGQRMLLETGLQETWDGVQMDPGKLDL